MGAQYESQHHSHKIQFLRKDEMRSRNRVLPPPLLFSLFATDHPTMLLSFVGGGANEDASVGQEKMPRFSSAALFFPWLSLLFSFSI